MTPRKNLILALVVAGVAYCALHVGRLPTHFDWFTHIDREWDWDRTATAPRAPGGSGSTADAPSAMIPGSGASAQDLLAAAMLVQRTHEAELLEVPGVVGIGVGWTDAGRTAIKVFVDPATTAMLALPAMLEDFPVSVEIAGPFYALPLREAPQDAVTAPRGAQTAAQEAVSAERAARGGSRDAELPLPTSRFDRPVPMGVSTGHTRSTAGTIGAVVTDGAVRYALSNWHVFVPAGQAEIGDMLLQPGPVDGGAAPADEIGTLAAFEPVVLTPFASNRIDAAIARTDDVMPRTPDGGYGSPRSETLKATPGLAVKKYGRTTRLTFGEVDAINATINVSYGSAGSQVGRFTGQIVLCCDMSQGGDSGSLIVAHDVDEDGNPGPDDRRPVALLFAGDQRRTIANPIDLVLDRFGVTIVGGEESGH